MTPLSDTTCKQRTPSCAFGSWVQHALDLAQTSTTRTVRDGDVFDLGSA